MSRRVRANDENGSSTLEVVGFIGVTAIVLMILVQGGLALYAITATETAARHAARASSLGESPQAAADAALPGWLSPNVVGTGAGNHGVEVSTDVPSLVPGFNVTVSRSAVMP